MCFVDRAINKIVIAYKFYVPSFDDMLNQLSGAIVFNKIDLKGGYHHIKIRLGDG